MKRHWSKQTEQSPDGGLFRRVRTNLVVNEVDYVETKNDYKAEQADDWDQVHPTMNDEVKTASDYETWNLLRPTTLRDVIAGKSVYSVKLGPSGLVDKSKACYFAKGFKQVEWLEYFETFPPTCKLQWFRCLLHLSAKRVVRCTSLMSRGISCTQQ